MLLCYLSEYDYFFLVKLLKITINVASTSAIPYLQQCFSLNSTFNVLIKHTFNVLIKHTFNVLFKHTFNVLNKHTFNVLFKHTFNVLFKVYILSI